MADAKLKSITNGETPRSRIDAKAEYLEPIDYSFKDLMKFEDIKATQPRYQGEKNKPKTQNDKYVSLSLKLGYNALTEVTGIYEWASDIFLQPELLSSLDISFNCLSHIPDEILKFVGLKCLYLHGNKIKGIEEVDKLNTLTKLTSLSLHGNPIELLPGFRLYVIKRIPYLKQLNFSAISKADHRTANTWSQINGGKIRQPIQEGHKKKSSKKTEE